MNNVFYFLLFLCFPFLVMTAPTDLSSDISSDYASFDGDHLILEGQVRVHHDLGNMEAKQAFLKRAAKDFPFSEIHLQENVFFSFQDQNELLCDEAYLDFLKRSGKVFSHESPVLYRDRKNDPLDLFSRQIDFQFLEKDDHIVEIASLLAKDNVHIDYADKYHLDSDRALFENKVLTAFGTSPASLCHMKHFHDKVDAKRIIIYLEDHLLQMESPHGVVTSFFFPGYPDRLCTFSSYFLIWDDQLNAMTLQKDILIQDDFLGVLEGEETIRFFQKEQFGRYIIQSIESEGKTTLKTANSLSAESHAVTSFGTLRLDRDNLLLTGTSPQINGITPLDKQLIYARGGMTLFANEATLEYSFYKMGLEPTSVDLSGRVRLISAGSSTPFRCGYADSVHYDPQTGQIHLLANSGNHVLFWHEEQHLKLSAREILITTDPETQKEVVKGIGCVRFSFNEEQQETLSKLFPNHIKGPS